MIHHGGFNILRSFDKDCITCFDIADYTLYGGTNEGDIIVCSLIYDHKYKLKIVTDFKVTPPCDTKLNVTITSIAISPCKKYLSIGNCNGVVVVFSIIKKDLLHILYSYDDHSGGISVLKWSRFESHKLFSGGTDGLVVELNCAYLLESNKSDSIDIFNQYFKSFISFVGIKSKVLTTVCHCSSAIYFIDCETIHRSGYLFDAVLVYCHHNVYIFHLPIQPLQEQPKFSQIDSSSVFQLGCGYFCKCIEDASHHNETVTGIIIFKSANKLLMLPNEYDAYNNHVIVHLYTIDGNFQEELLLTKLGNIQNKEISIRSIHGFVDTSLYTSRILVCVSENRDILYVNLVERTIEAVEFSNADYFSNCTISVRTDNNNIFILHEYPSHNPVADDVLLIGIDIISIANIGFNYYKRNKPIMIYSYNLYFHNFIKLQKRWIRYCNNIKHRQKLCYTSSFVNQDLNSVFNNNKKNKQKNILHRLQTTSSILEEVETILPHSEDLNSVLMYNIDHNERTVIDKSIENFTGIEANEVEWRAICEYNDLTDVHHDTYIWLKDTAGTWAEKWNDSQENVLKSKLFSRRSVKTTIAECKNKCLISFENDIDTDFNVSRKLNRQYSVTLDTTNGIGLILSIGHSNDISTIIFVQGFHNLTNGSPRYCILFFYFATIFTK